MDQQVPHCLSVISPKAEEHTLVRLPSKRGRDWTPAPSSSTMEKDANGQVPSPSTQDLPFFETRAFRVLNAGGQWVLASCEETSSSPCPPKPGTKALGSLRALKFLWLSQMLHICGAMTYDWMHALRPLQLQSNMHKLKITTK